MEIIIINTIFILFIHNLAFAYLDPGSGSYFFQILIAAFIGFIFSIKLYWKKIFGLFKKIIKRNKSNE